MRWNHRNRRAGMAAVAVRGHRLLQRRRQRPLADGDRRSGWHPAACRSGTVGTALPTPIGVRVTDAGGDAVAGVAVTFAVTAGGGSVAAAAPVTTNAQGEASTTWTIGTVAGASATTSRRRRRPGSPGSPVTFRASGSGRARRGGACRCRGTTRTPSFFQRRRPRSSPRSTTPTAIRWSGPRSTGRSPAAGRVPSAATVTDALGRTSVTRTVGGTMSGYITTASLPSGGAAFFDFVTLGTAVPSSYNVEVVFLTPVTANQRTAFLDAAARWSSIVVSSFPAGPVIADANELRQQHAGHRPGHHLGADLRDDRADRRAGPDPRRGLPCWVRHSGRT